MYLDANFLIPAPGSTVLRASLKALATTAGFSKNIPLAAENPVAENMFLK